MDTQALPEEPARRVWALRTLEAARSGALWSEADRQWATAQALQAIRPSGPAGPAGPAGNEAPAPRISHAAFHEARANAAWPRLEERLPGLQALLQAQPLAWLAPLLLGAALLAGAAIDHLGGGQRINLLAPPVWAVVLWNLAVYAALAWGALRTASPAAAASSAGAGALLTRALQWLQHRVSPAPAPSAAAEPAAALLAQVQAADLRLTGPLQAQRLLRTLHLAAAALALGLVAGMYLRGLVLDYRAGWQSTFLSAPQVQATLNLLLSPASAATGVAVPAVQALQVAPESAPAGQAAPWLHLYAATLLLWVVLPRAALALLAHWRARGIASRLLVPQDDEALAALATSATAPPLHLLVWPVDEPAQAALPRLQALLHSSTPPGIELEVLAQLPQATPAPRHRLAAWWQRWRQPAVAQQTEALLQLRRRSELVLALGEPAPAARDALHRLARPLLVLPLASADSGAPSLQRFTRHWAAEAAAWPWLAQALPPARQAALLQMGQAAARAHERRFSAAVALLAQHLAEMARDVEPAVPAAPAAGQAPAATEEPSAALRQRAQARALRWRAELLALHDLAPVLEASAPAADAGGSASGTAPQLRRQLPEGKAALLGGALTGALTGLKADLASGGLTMGGGMLAGGLIGALGAAGAARGANRIRGTAADHWRWPPEALQAAAQQALADYLHVIETPRLPESGGAALTESLPAALSRDAAAWQALWPALQGEAAGHAETASPARDALAARLEAALRQVLQSAPPVEAAGFARAESRP